MLDEVAPGPRVPSAVDLLHDLTVEQSRLGLESPILALKCTVAIEEDDGRIDRLHPVVQLEVKAIAAIDDNLIEQVPDIESLQDVSEVYQLNKTVLIGTLLLVVDVHLKISKERGHVDRVGRFELVLLPIEDVVRLIEAAEILDLEDASIRLAEFLSILIYFRRQGLTARHLHL